MKLFISASLKEKVLDPRFGRCEGFYIYDLEKGQIDSVANPGFNSSGGAGISAANFLVDQKVDVLITGNLGPNAKNVLKNSNITVYTSGAKKVDEVIEDYKNNKLEKLI